MLKPRSVFHVLCAYVLPEQNKYNAVLVVLLVGSFLIPMLQYWWYIRDEDDNYE